MTNAVYDALPRLDIDTSEAKTEEQEEELAAAQILAFAQELGQGQLFTVWYETNEPESNEAHHYDVLFLEPDGRIGNARTQIEDDIERGPEPEQVLV